MTDVELAYALAKIYDNKETKYCKLSDTQLNLLCLSNQNGTYIIETNTKKAIEISMSSLIEDIVDFTYDLSKSYNYDKSKLLYASISNIVVENIEDDWAILEVDGNCYDIPYYFLPYNAKSSDILNNDLSINIDKTQEQKNSIRNKLDCLLDR